MKDIKDVTIEDLTHFFMDKSEGWTPRTRTETKKKAVIFDVGKFALVKTRDYSNYYCFGRIERILEDNFLLREPTIGQWINYKDVQELIVENR